MDDSKARLRATAIGFSAVLMWATLALFTALSGKVPPFQLLAMCFSVATVIACIFWLARGQNPLTYMRQPAPVWLLGVGGLFGYHFFYFLALRNAPAVEAGLIAYLWPLLIVLFSGLLPGERLGLRHVLGALAALAGAALLVLRGQALAIDMAALPGLGIALLCALVWSGYSVLSRRIGHITTDSVAVFCLATAVLSVPLHLALEETVWPVSALGWASVIGLGLGPVGLAFYVWDIGVKQGDIQLLGVASYAAPLFSTLILVATGIAPPSPVLFLAALLITGGAALAAWGSRRPVRART